MGLSILKKTIPSSLFFLMENAIISKKFPTFLGKIRVIDSKR